MFWHKNRNLLRLLLTDTIVFIQEFSERDRCNAKLIIHRLPESFSPDPAINIADDKCTLAAILCKNYP